MPPAISPVARERLWGPVGGANLDGVLDDWSLPLSSHIANPMIGRIRKIAGK